MGLHIALFGRMRNLITPALAAQLGAALKTDPATVTKGAEVALPLLTTALARTASTPGGAAHVLRLVERADGSALANLSQYVAAFRAAEGEAALAPIFGPGQGAVFASLRRSLGVDLAPLTAIAAPITLTFLATVAREQRLDAQGLARVLRAEARDFARSGSPATAMIGAALRAGDEQAALQAPLSEEV